MNQGIDTAPSAPSGHMLRLLLIFLGAVFGLLILSFVFGSSSASAAESDENPDGLGQLGGIVATVTEPVQQVLAPAVPAPSAPVSAIVSPITATVDSTLTTLVGTEVLGSTPVTSVVDPVVGAVDTALVDVTTTVTPVIHAFDLTGTLAGHLPVQAAAASGTAALTAIDAIGGIAAGTLDLGGLSPAGTDPSNAGTAPAGLGLLATTLGAGFAALLLVRSQRLAPIEMPGSPVYATDSSPD